MTLSDTRGISLRFMMTFLIGLFLLIQYVRTVVNQSWTRTSHQIKTAFNMLMINTKAETGHLLDLSMMGETLEAQAEVETLDQRRLIMKIPHTVMSKPTLRLQNLDNLSNSSKNCLKSSNN